MAKEINTSPKEAKPRKMNSFISNLVNDGEKIEKQVVGSQKLSDVTQAQPLVTNAPEVPINPIEELSEKKENIVVAAPISKPTPVQSQAQGWDAFLKDRKKETEVVMAVVSRSQRDELKIVATAVGQNLQDLIANIFDNFLEINQVEIKKAKKKLLG